MTPRTGPARRSTFRRRCVHLQPGFVGPAQCAGLLDAVTAWLATHPTELIHHAVPGRDLRYHVIDGHEFAHAVADAATLVERVRAAAELRWQGPLTLIDDRRAARNVNVTPPGGSYRWHFDRNRVTALLYLNEVGGGHTELYPNHRLHLGGRLARLQRTLDRLAATRTVRGMRGTPVVIAPAAGTLVVLRGDRTLHSVRPVTGTADRINIVLAFDIPGARRTLHRLDDYLYRTERHRRRVALPTTRAGDRPAAPADPVSVSVGVTGTVVAPPPAPRLGRFKS